jgi:hypothetical protein
MGKGRILTAHGEGRYTIEILEDRARAESAKALAEARVVDLGTRISDLETEYTDAQAVVDAAATDIDQAIDDYHAEILADGTSATDIGAVTTELTVELQEAASKRDAIAGQISTLKSQRLAAQKRISLIDALPPLRQQEAWCADYTEDLSGDVATAEVPGEIGQVIVKPGFEGANQWSAAEDGAIQPALSGTPASVFYNLAMMPGWQKWRPTFRIATISNIDNDLCDITLDAATSSQQGLGVNAERGYSGVPIMYMDCNGDAFEDGDSVLVGFSGNTDAPMVVGFEKEPKQCSNCNPVQIGASGTGTWEVDLLYGNEPVEACPDDEWRIYSTIEGRVVFSGGMIRVDRDVFLDGLPVSIDAQFTEQVIDGPHHCFPDEEIQMTAGIPSPDPVFWGGSWGSGYLGGGNITDGGRLEWSPGYLGGSYLVIWTVDDCFQWEMSFTTPRRYYVLQIGCKQRDGAVVWPPTP